jgi:HSP20 family protein
MIVIRRGRTRAVGMRPAEVDELFRAYVPGRPVAFASRGGGRWRPAIEVYETDEALIITAEIAGLQRDEIDVALEGDVLTIRGKRPDTAPCESTRTYHEARISYGEFGADVYVPFPVNAEAAEASYDAGMLRITLPRARGRTIVPTRADEPATS